MTTSDFTCSEAGYTLIEMLSAVAVSLLLGAIAIPSYSAYVKQARIGKTIIEIRMLETEISVYNKNTDQYPDTLGDILKSDLKDPWGRPYEYLRIDGGGENGKGKLRRDRFLNPLNTDYDLYSLGEDGKSAMNLNAKDSEDDIVRVLGGNYIGIAEKF